MRKAAWIGAGMLAAAQALAGFTYTSHTKVEGGPAQQAGDLGVTMRTVVDGPKARIEFVESSSPVTAAGSFMLTKDGGQSVILADPEDKTYMKWDIAKMMGGASATMKMMNMTFSNVKCEMLLDEAGPTLLGFSTRHYRIRLSYKTEMGFMGMKVSSTVDQEQDIWATDELKDAGFGLWTKKQAITVGDAQVDALVKAQMDKVRGFPLKMVIATTNKDSSGETQTTKSTTEVTGMKRGDVPASAFELPADYTEQTASP